MIGLVNRARYHWRGRPGRFGHLGIGFVEQLGDGEFAGLIDDKDR
jgi:hypothetical protein